MKTPDQLKALREKLIQHLESAQALADETGDANAGYLIEMELDQIRSAHWPAS